MSFALCTCSCAWLCYVNGNGRRWQVGDLPTLGLREQGHTEAPVQLVPLQWLEARADPSLQPSWGHAACCGVKDEDRERSSEEHQEPHCLTCHTFPLLIASSSRFFRWFLFRLFNCFVLVLLFIFSFPFGSSFCPFPPFFFLSLLFVVFLFSFYFLFPLFLHIPIISFATLFTPVLVGHWHFTAPDFCFIFSLFSFRVLLLLLLHFHHLFPFSLGLNGRSTHLHLLLVV